MTTPPPEDERWQPLAGLLACLLPGAGHVFLGYLHRGLLIAGGVLGLFFGGLFVGGLDSVDAREDTIWFVGQALVGPIAIGVNAVHQANFKGFDQNGRHRSPGPEEGLERRQDRAGQSALVIVPGSEPPIRKSLGRANELGTLFGALAGMMNLIAILDAFHGVRRRRHGAPA